MKNIGKCALTLGSIAIIIALLLALANSATEKIISERDAKQEEQTRTELIIGIEYDEILKDNEVWQYKFQGKTVAWTTIGSGNGYGGEIKMLIALDENYKVINSEIISMNETPNIGTKAKEQSFLSQFIGKSSIESFDAISGATVTSKAVKDIIQNTIEEISSYEPDEEPEVGPPAI